MVYGEFFTVSTGFSTKISGKQPFLRGRIHSFFGKNASIQGKAHITIYIKQYCAHFDLPIGAFSFHNK